MTIEEWTRRHNETIEEWRQLGHPDDSARCVGHTYPNNDCPNPDVHKQVFPSIITSVGRHSADGGDSWHTLGSCAECREVK